MSIIVLILHFISLQINLSLNLSSGTFRISVISIIGALNSSFWGLYVPCNDRFFLAMNTNMMTPIAAMKSMPQMDGIIATKKSEFSNPGYVLELGGSDIGNGCVVLLT